MNELVYPRERTLSGITLVLGLLIWLAIVFGAFGLFGPFGTVGFALAILLFGFIVYLFVQSASIANIKGNGIELSAAQFPDLYAQFIDCCKRLQIDTPPQAFVVNGNGVLNAFATKFLRTQYVVLNSGVVDAMSEHVDGVRFYLGHELGHLRMKHLSKHFFRWPVLWLPLLGAAYARACESTCDRHGRACSSSPESAARALTALAAGASQWQLLNVETYVTQSEHSSGFWMSFHELTAGYPWLTKRASRVIDINARMPRRNGFAYLPALFVPYTGRLGAGFGFIVTVYIVGVLAAIALPAYQDYTVRAKVSIAVAGSEPMREALGNYYESTGRIPQSLDVVGAKSQLADGTPLILNSKNMVLTAKTKQGELIFVPAADEQKHVFWTCRNGQGLKASQLPLSCRARGNQ